METIIKIPFSVYQTHINQKSILSSSYTLYNGYKFASLNKSRVESKQLHVAFIFVHTDMHTELLPSYKGKTIPASHVTVITLSFRPYKF